MRGARPAPAQSTTTRPSLPGRDDVRDDEVGVDQADGQAVAVVDVLERTAQHVVGRTVSRRDQPAGVLQHRARGLELGRRPAVREVVPRRRRPRAHAGSREVEHIEPREQLAHGSEPAGIPERRAALIPPDPGDVAGDDQPLAVERGHGLVRRAPFRGIADGLEPEQDLGVSLRELDRPGGRKQPCDPRRTTALIDAEDPAIELGDLRHLDPVRGLEMRREADPPRSAARRARPARPCDAWTGAFHDYGRIRCVSCARELTPCLR